MGIPTDRSAAGMATALEPTPVSDPTRTIAASTPTAVFNLAARTGQSIRKTVQYARGAEPRRWQVAHPVPTTLRLEAMTDLGAELDVTRSALNPDVLQRRALEPTPAASCLGKLSLPQCLHDLACNVARLPFPWEVMTADARSGI